MDKIFIRNREIATKEYVDAVAGGGTSVDLSNYYTKEEINSKGFVPTFKWDGLSGEDNPSNLQLFTDFYKAFTEYNGRVHLLAMTPNAQNPTYMRLDVQVDIPQGGQEYFYFTAIPTWSTWENNSDQVYAFYQGTSSAVFKNGECIQIDELSDWEAEIAVLSTTVEYDEGDYYTPYTDGNPVSKGYLNEVLEEKGYLTQDDMSGIYYTKEEVDAAIAAALAEIQADLASAKANLETLTNLEAGE